MANEAEKQPTAAELQAKANLEAATKYKTMVGQKFTDGKQVAEVRQYIPSMLKGSGPRQCFLVNFGHPNASFFMPCKEFTETFNQESTENPVSVIDMHPVTLPQ